MSKTRRRVKAKLEKITFKRGIYWREKEGGGMEKYKTGNVTARGANFYILSSFLFFCVFKA